MPKNYTAGSISAAGFLRLADARKKRYIIVPLQIVKKAILDC